MDGLLCVLTDLDHPIAACAGDSLPVRIRSRLERARFRLFAWTTGTDPRVARAIARSVSRTFARTRMAVMRTQSRGGLSPACARALDGLLQDAETRIARWLQG